jgi:hypothetical protein
MKFETTLDEYELIVRTFAGCAPSGWHRKPCPRCEDIDGKLDYKMSLGFNASTGGYNCFRCGMQGRLSKHWRKKLDLDEFDGELEPDEKIDQDEVPVEAPDGFMPLFEEPGASACVFDAARDYLVRSKAEKGRGMDPGTARAMAIGASVGGRLAGRVIVPIPNYASPEKPLRGWVARDYVGYSVLPYRYPKGMSRDGLLYNEPALWVESVDPVFVVEGVFDAAPLWPDAVACMGKPLESHLEKLKGAKRPVVICLDGDAWEEAWAWSMTMRHLGKRAGSVRLPPRTDPDEVIREHLRRVARQALSEDFPMPWKTDG